MVRARRQYDQETADVGSRVRIVDHGNGRSEELIAIFVGRPERCVARIIFNLIQSGHTRKRIIGRVTFRGGVSR